MPTAPAQPLLVNLGRGVAHDVRIDLHPISQRALTDAGYRLMLGTPATIDPRIQHGDTTLITLELLDGN